MPSIKQLRPYFGVLALSVLVVVLRLPLAMQGIGWDEGLFAYMAKHWDSDHLIYRDMIDIKLPGIFLFYKMCFFLFGTSDLAVILGGILAALTGLWAFMALSWELGMRRSAWWAGLSYTLLICSPLLLANGLQPELAMQLPVCLGLWCFFRFEKTKRTGWLWAAAFSISVAYFIKQFAAVLFLLMMYCAWRRGGSDQKKRISLIVFVSGMTLAFLYLITVSYFVINNGVSEFWYWTHERLLIYISLGMKVVPVGLAILVLFSLVLLLGSMSYALNRGYRSRSRIDELAVVWLVLTLVIISATFRFFPYYFIFAVPPVSILAGRYAAWIASDRLKRFRHLLIPVSFGTAAAVWCMTQIIYVVPASSSGIYGLTREWDVMGQAAEYIRASTGPEDHVWSFTSSAWLGWLSDRPGCTRYLLAAEHAKDVSGPLNRQREYADEFSACRPGFYLTRDMQTNLIPAELSAGLSEQYRREVSIGSYTIYRRID